MDELVEFLRARLDEEELWATEASRSDDSQTTAGGVHWQWVEPETDTPVTADPSRGEHLTDDAGHFRFALRSVEEFPTEHVGPLPQFAIPSAEEISAAVAGHIVRHDPARVLREIEAKRRLLDEHKPDRPKGRPNMERHCLTCTTAQAWDETASESNCLTLRLLALPYEDRPGYREDWRP
ncbi:DUF6221 family protein [Streptomyces flaveolus]|uniref:DUF6221 family protein n=1 Tax=Streptomyces flaveolus TaxID=67297 RepID=UPI0034066CEF